MGGRREQSQGSPAASMGRLSLISIFAAPLRNLEEMRLCMLKRVASLQGNGQGCEHRRKNPPQIRQRRVEEREKVGEVGGVGRGNKGRERTKMLAASCQHPQR